MENLIARLAIEPADTHVAALARARFDALAKPQGSLGVLEEDVVRICALRRTTSPRLKKRAVVVLAADNGVIAQGVSSSGPEVTRLVTENVARGTSSVNRMAMTAGIDVVVADLGMFKPSDVCGITDLRVREATADITRGPAMSRAEALQAIEAGVGLARELAEAGYDLVCTGEVGIGNTTTATAVACALTGASPASICGRGAGLTDEGLSRKVLAIERALAVNRPDVSDALDVLSKVAGLDIAGMCGVFLGCAAARVPVVVDGLISAAAAALAGLLIPAATDAMLASHVSAEPAQKLLLERLGLSAAISCSMRLGEGTGACALVPLLDMALSVFEGTATLEDSLISSHDSKGDPCA